MESFDINNTPDQEESVAIVTGANTGLGFETTLALAKKKMTIVMACRNEKKADEARKTILVNHPESKLDFIPLDLASLKSVGDFAKSFKDKYKRLDLLINNAGLMFPPYFKTEDGFESQMGINYLGHFLLTNLLMGTINQTQNARVVMLSSIAHKSGFINFDDMQWEQKYSKSKAYSQSKLACLIFALVLDRKLKEKGHNTKVLAAHPGVSNTELARHIPKILYYLFLPLFSLITHKPEKGALPTLKAALDPNAEGGEYFGPTGYREMKGSPGKAEIKPQALEQEVQQKLWHVSEKLTGTDFNL